MGVSLCTVPMVKEELQAIMLIGVEGESTAVFSALQDSITLEHLCGEEYKVSASVQPLFDTP